jgi:hypothetical protein
MKGLLRVLRSYRCLVLTHKACTVTPLYVPRTTVTSRGYVKYWLLVITYTNKLNTNLIYCLIRNLKNSESNKDFFLGIIYLFTMLLSGS